MDFKTSNLLELMWVRMELVRGDVCKIPKMLPIVDQRHLHPVEIQIEDELFGGSELEFGCQNGVLSNEEVGRFPKNALRQYFTARLPVSGSNFENVSIGIKQLDREEDVLKAENQVAALGGRRVVFRVPKLTLCQVQTITLG